MYRTGELQWMRGKGKVQSTTSRGEGEFEQDEVTQYRCTGESEGMRCRGGGRGGSSRNEAPLDEECDGRVVEELLVPKGA
jgi:hypothetical protein